MLMGYKCAVIGVDEHEDVDAQHHRQAHFLTASRLPKIVILLIR